jgi:hypothetical protein
MRKKEAETGKGKADYLVVLFQMKNVVAVIQQQLVRLATVA